jgi:hypothetical protein
VKTLGKCALGETGAQPARKDYPSRMQAVFGKKDARMVQSHPLSAQTLSCLAEKTARDPTETCPLTS